MHYSGNIFRPPSEAQSILLQVTTGCSHNKCTFCGMYKNAPFTIKDQNQIMADIEFASQYCRNQKRLFLCDGDVLIVSQKILVAILKEIRQKLPWVTRVGVYANSKSIKRKTGKELEELRDLGLTIAYMGLESGDGVTLEKIRKGADPSRMIEMGKKIREAGINLSITVLLGVAGIDRSHEHGVETGKVLTAIDPEYVGALSLMLTPGTPLFDDYNKGKFHLLNSHEMLKELEIMFRSTHLSNGYFHANHASNYLPIKAKLPEQREETLTLLNRAINGEVDLKPEHLRAL